MLTRRARPKTKFLYYTRRSLIFRQIQIMIKSISEANVLIWSCGKGGNDVRSIDGDDPAQG
jgi:hypothetical protein